MNGEQTKPVESRTEEDQSTRLAHERLSKAAAAGGFTTGGVTRWGASEANCAAAAMERANYYAKQLERVHMAACYASEEDTDARAETLLLIGKICRGEIDV